MASERVGKRPVVVLESDDPLYPRLLACIEDPPDPLRVCGQSSDLAAFFAVPSVGIVGSRSCSLAAEAFARKLGRDLARQGWVVVSGLARGIDAAAHRGALEAGGRTLAVVGCGLDILYPRVNRDLRSAILDNGLLVGEYAPGTPPRKQNFPARNRILSGLSCAVVVVEAGQRSGSLITARLALAQGREVLAVPGLPLDGRSRGSNGLLRDGAGLVECAADVGEAMSWLASWSPLLRGPLPSDPEAEKTAVLVGPGAQAAPELDPDAEVTRVPAISALEVLIDRGVQSVDELAAATGAAIGELQAQLFALEQAGRICRLADGSFRRS